MMHLFWIHSSILSGIVYASVHAHVLDEAGECERGIIKRIEWKEEKARSGATVTTIFQELSSRNLKCPVIVNGNKLLETKPVRKWASFEYLERKCKASSVVDVKSEEDGTFTYYDKNTAYAKRASPGDIGAHESLQLESWEFLDVLRNGPLLNASVHRFARFGGKLSQSPCTGLARDAAEDYALPPGDGAELGASRQGSRPTRAQGSPSIWIASPGAGSSFHFDLFDNLYAPVVGTKQVALAEPTARVIRALAPFPGTHPHARQAQYRSALSGCAALDPSAGLAEQETEQAAPANSAEEVCESGLGDPVAGAVLAGQIAVVHLAPGEALWIPSGWFHELRGDEHSGFTLSLSLTANAPELSIFNRWLTSREGAFALPSHGGPFTVRRLGALLLVYLPSLLRQVDLEGDGLGGERGQGGAEWALGLLAKGSYSPAVRAHLGLEVWPQKLITEQRKKSAHSVY